MDQVAAIGLDSAEWWVLEHLMAEGHMPHLQALRARSAECRLEAEWPYRSELPWTQFLTGRSARENDYWSTAAFDPSDYSVAMVGAHPTAPFYERDDVSVIAFDLPHSTIRPGVTGAQITAWGAHAPQYPRASRPTGLLTEIDARFGVHPALDNDFNGGWHQPRYLDAIGSALVDGAGKRIDVARWLVENHDDWDLFMTVMSESHSAGHLYWNGIDETHPLHHASTADQSREWFIRVHRTIDDGIGRLVAALPDDAAVVVFAVHGMQTNVTDIPSLALLPEIAHRLHFGEPLLLDVGQRRWSRRGFPPVQPAERLIWRDVVKQRFAPTEHDRRRKRLRLAAPDLPIAFARRAQRRLTGRPRVAWDLNTSFAPESDQSVEEMAAIRAKLEWQPPTFYRRYWPRMEWFVLPTFSDAHVRINVAGRERDGLVPVDDFDAACERFERTVRQCVNPRTGNPAVAAVHRMREHPLEPNGPDGDLVVEWTEPVDALVHPDTGMVGPLPFQRTGEHSVNGFALVSGPEIQPTDLGVRSAYDLPPTILSLLGRTPGPELVGTPFVAKASTA